VTEQTEFACARCGDVFHYIDTRIIDGKRYCLLCGTNLTDEMTAELARLRAELDAANKWVLDLGLVGIDGIKTSEAQAAELARLRAALAEAERDNASLKAVGRAVLVAARSMWWALRHMGGNQPFFIAMVRSNCAYFNRLGVTSEVEIRDRFSEKPEA